MSGGESVTGAWRGGRHGIGVGLVSRSLALAALASLCGFGAMGAAVAADSADPWASMSLVGSAAKLSSAASGSERDGAAKRWLPGLSLGAGYRWFDDAAPLSDAPYVRLSLTWPELLHRRVGVELYADHSRTELEQRRTTVATVRIPVPPDPENPSSETQQIQRTLIRTDHDEGHLWQLGAGVRPRLYTVDGEQLDVALSGRVGASVTFLDFATVDDTLPGLYAGLGVEVSPADYLSFSVEALAHWLAGSEVTERSFWMITAGVAVTFRF